VTTLSDDRAADQKQEQLLAGRREGLKLFFDVFKHLTTLCTGSIVLLATFHEKLSGTAKWQSLIAIAFAGFIVSIAGSVVLMLSTARSIRRNETSDQLTDRMGNLSYLVAVTGFAVGAVCLGVFGVRNLF
jgi:hypothetical protein